MANYSETKLRKMVLTAIQDGCKSLREIVAKYGLELEYTRLVRIFQELQLEGTICYKSGHGFAVCDKNYIG